MIAPSIRANYFKTERSSIWRLPIFGGDFGLLFWGKNASRILKFIVREMSSPSMLKLAHDYGGCASWPSTG